MAHGKDRPCTTLLPRALGLLVCVVLVSSCSGCSLSYILHTAAGQFHIQNNAIPVEEALEDPGLGAK
jgi:hypothetical protein